MAKLSVIGLGKLGVCSAACFAYKGFDVIGVDINNDLVNAINSGVAPVYEPGLQELITSAKDRLKATEDYEEVIKSSDTTFFILPTPSNEDGYFSNKYLISALRPLAAAMKESNKAYHLFVITSTVSPGSIDGSLIPLIEKTSRRKLNDGFGVCYNPEFIALGSVITDFLNPDMVLIGESNEFAGEQLTKIYKTVCKNNPYIARMSIISAEITKISLNSYVTMKISYANTLANICEAIPGANIDHITKAMGADKRISPYYLKGGISYGGPCFPRDNRAFAAFAEKYGIDAKLAKATDEVNRFQVKHLTDLVMEQITDGNKAVSVLGLSYKPDSPVIEESPSIRLIEELLKKNIKVICYDPLAIDNTMAVFGDRIYYAISIEECLLNSSICIIATEAEEFKSINNSYIVNNPITIIDCWRMLDPEKLNKVVKYIALGKAKQEGRV